MGMVVKMRPWCRPAGPDDRLQEGAQLSNPDAVLLGVRWRLEVRQTAHPRGIHLAWQ